MICIPDSFYFLDNQVSQNDNCIFLRKVVLQRGQSLLKAPMLLHHHKRKNLANKVG